MSEEQGHPDYLWWNGHQVRWEDATVHVTDLGWSTVGAIFEGIRAYWNADQEELYIFRFEEHLQRLVRSCRLVRLDLTYSDQELHDATVALMRANGTREDTYIRPMVYAGNTSGKRFSQLTQEAAVLINTHPMTSHLLTGFSQTAKVSSWTRISDRVMPPRAKNFSNYRNGQLASLEARADGYNVGIMLNDQGFVSEAPGACVMMVSDGKLVTPDARQSILESITRDALLVLAREELGLEVVERSVERTELYLADEVFTCGTAAEITPITSVDRYDVGNGQIGPITQRLNQLFDRVLRGSEDRYAHWRTPVGVRSAVAV